MRIKKPASPKKTGGSVNVRLELSKPYCLPGEEIGCTLVIRTQRPIRYKAISAELTCCEKFFINGSRLTRIPHKHVVRVSGPGTALPPRTSLYFTMAIPSEAKPTYLGSSILRVWRVRTFLEFGLAPNIAVEEDLLIISSIDREGQRSAHACRGPLRLEITLKKGLFLPGEALKGHVFLSHPLAIRSLRVELFAIEKLCIERFGEVSLTRCLRRAFLPVKKMAFFSLQAPSYSPFVDICSSAIYVLRAVASLRAEGELVADLPISIGVLRTARPRRHHITSEGGY